VLRTRLSRLGMSAVFVCTFDSYRHLDESEYMRERTETYPASWASCPRITLSSLFLSKNWQVASYLSGYSQHVVLIVSINNQLSILRRTSIKFIECKFTQPVSSLFTNTGIFGEITLTYRRNCNPSYRYGYMLDRLHSPKRVWYH
jgi:hypothetical protein